jgi:hypothetical protein
MPRGALAIRGGRLESSDVAAGALSVIGTNVGIIAKTVSLPNSDADGGFGLYVGSYNILSTGATTERYP